MQILQDRLLSLKQLSFLSIFEQAATEYSCLPELGTVLQNSLYNGAPAFSSVSVSGAAPAPSVAVPAPTSGVSACVESESGGAVLSSSVPVSPVSALEDSDGAALEDSVGAGVGVAVGVSVGVSVGLGTAAPEWSPLQ